MEPVRHRSSGGRASIYPPGFTAGLSVYTSQRGYHPAQLPTPRPVLPPQGPGRQLSGYDRRWPRIFAAERRRIRAALGSVAIAVEHVGSSSIPGMSGRPEIDILIGVTDVDMATPLLTTHGYLTENRSGPGSEPWSLLSKPGQISFELLAVEHLGPLWTRHLGLRDYLRRDPARAQAYSRLKYHWAAEYGPDTSGYKAAKRRFWAAVRDTAA